MKLEPQTFTLKVTLPRVGTVRHESGVVDTKLLYAISEYGVKQLDHFTLRQDFFSPIKFNKNW